MKVYNRSEGDIPQGCVRIMRPSKWGNPYIIGKDGDRRTVLRKYAVWLNDNLSDNDFLQDLKELSKASGLICCCKPLDCHGDLLIQVMKKLGYIDISEFLNASPKETAQEN